jgi:hypothetical protein
MKNDPAHTYYAEFMGKTCNLRNLEKKIVRRFIMQSDIVNAQVSGAGDDAIVAIVCKDGHSYVYSSDGRLIRK